MQSRPGLLQTRAVVTRALLTPEQVQAARGKRGRPAVNVTIPIVDLHDLASHAIHHGNCSLDSWSEGLTRCACGLFQLLDRLEPAWRDDPKIEDTL